MSTYTLGTLKEWYNAGAQGQNSDIKRRLKDLLKIDPNPTLGETLLTTYTAPEPALIFKKGNFEARLRLSAVENYLKNNWKTPTTPKAWLKENLVSQYGKVLLAEKQTFLIDTPELGQWFSCGRNAVKITTKAPIPTEIQVIGNTSHQLKAHITQGEPLATINTKALYSFIRPFSKSDTLELQVTHNALLIRAFKKDTLEGSTSIPVECFKPCTVKVNTKVFNALIQHYPLEDLTLGDNGTCTTLDDLAILSHFKGYPLDTNA